MKQNSTFCVINSVLTYFKDVFDGTSPYWGRSRFLFGVGSLHSFFESACLRHAEWHLRNAHHPASAGINVTLSGLCKASRLTSRSA
jgi:hypothetical protein